MQRSRNNVSPRFRLEPIVGNGDLEGRREEATTPWEQWRQLWADAGAEGAHEIWSNFKVRFWRITHVGIADWASQWQFNRLSPLALPMLIPWIKTLSTGQTQKGFGFTDHTLMLKLPDTEVQSRKSCVQLTGVSETVHKIKRKKLSKRILVLRNHDAKIKRAHFQLNEFLKKSNLGSLMVF